MKLFKKYLIIFCTFLLLPCFIVKADNKITQEDIIYFIMTDRFYDGDTSNNQGVIKGNLSSYNGGDFQGIIDKLDYIKSLGFTAIWISPVVENDVGGYHGYWATDYYKTNEHFGSLEKLKELVNKAHEKNIKVIVDIALNHVGHNHPFVSDPKYEKWFHEYSDINDYNDQNQVENGWLGRLPDLDQNNPEVSKYLIDMAKWWIKETNIDGFRLDAARHVPKSFWIEFSKEIKKDFPNFYLIGEVFNGNPDYVGAYQNAGIDGLLDFPMYYAINNVFKESKPVFEISSLIKKSESSYPNRYLMGTFIDNHDVPRFIFQTDKYKIERLKNALTFIMTYTGIPVVYYGTEVPLNGEFDPSNRDNMDWNKKPELFDYIKMLTDIRKQNKALTHGDISVLSVSNDFLCYLRKYEDNTVIVAFNTSEKAKKENIIIPDKNQKQLTDLLTSKNIKIKNGKALIEMEPFQSYIFVYSKASSNNLLYYIATPVILLLTAVIILYIKLKHKKEV